MYSIDIHISLPQTGYHEKATQQNRSAAVITVNIQQPLTQLHCVSTELMA